MSDVQKSEFFLEEAKPYLNQVSSASRRNLGTFYLAYVDGFSYAITFKYTDQWEVNTCVKWMR
ncbi:hypothetical protein [Dyadobacter alkalitolerans]|uniref:hypothetical protein n=1 Tax=Dyadobacter alkalitolerans TaxID=492736 RepID=UPI000479863D|nr:hypothetical protein [Dyadobacter alkalitolerans]